MLSPTDSPRRPIARISSLAFASAILALIFGICYGASSFWDSSHGAFVSLKGCTFIAGLFLTIGLIAARIGKLNFRQLISSHELTPALIVVSLWLCLDTITRPYAWFAGLPVRGEIFVCGCLALLALRFIPSRLVFVTLATLSCIVPIITFLHYVGGELLISDDHASFYYRLILLKNNLLSIPFYNTDWNGGYDARDFFATGSLNVFPVFAALSSFLNDTTSYNLTATWVGFILPALSLYWATRITTRSVAAALVAASLACGSGLIWYRWALVYGTLGFCTSAALFPLIAALLYRAISDPEYLTRKRDMLIFILLSTLFLAWPGSAFMLAPLLVAAICFCRSLLKKRYLLLTFAIIACINLPWMLLFAKVSQVGSFITVTDKADEAQQKQKQALLGARGQGGDISLSRTLKIIRENAGSTNPLIPILVLPGLLFLPRASRIIFGGSIFYLLMIGAFFSPLKPHLELDRMVLVGMLVSIVPVSLLITRTLSEYNLESTVQSNSKLPYGWLKAALMIIPAGMLFSSPFIAGGVSANRSVLHYFISDDTWDAVAESIREFGSQNGRVLFSGFLLHELDGGHAAPLPALTGVPSIASSQFHNLWAYRQVFPKSFIERADQGIEEYLNLMNVGAIFAHDRQWRDYFAARPDKYQLRKNIGRFAFYERKDFISNYLREGSAQDIKITQNSVTLTPLTSQIILKFNYLPFLESSGCVMKSEKIAPEVEFIKLDSCIPGQQIVIKAKSPLRRLLS